MREIHMLPSISYRFLDEMYLLCSLFGNVVYSGIDASLISDLASMMVVEEQQSLVWLCFLLVCIHVSQPSVE